MAAVPSPEDTGKTGKTVMIVDDERDITRPMELGLEREGIDVTAFNDPLLALEEVKKRQRRYDLIITDIWMLHMNGLELYREIRKYDADVPICFMTALDMYADEFRQMFPDIEPAGFLRKPILIADVVEAINRMVHAQHRGMLEA